MVKKILAGFGGALALNLVHELIRKNFTNVPHVNEVGEEALQKGLSKFNLKIKDKNELYAATLAGDIVSNAIYFATTATGTGLVSGALAGVGAVALPRHMGLNDEPVAGNDRKKVMTIGYYLLGALVTKYIYNKLKK